MREMWGQSQGCRKFVKHNPKSNISNEQQKQVALFYFLLTYSISVSLLQKESMYIADIGVKI